MTELAPTETTSPLTTVVTWNVNSLGARFERVVEYLTTRQPDVVLIQETKQSEEKFLTREFAELGYESAHYGQGQWNGVAILSRNGMSDVQRGFGDDDPEARVISARVGEWRVYSCYVPNGRALDNPHYAYKLAWLEKLREEVVRRRGERLLLGGDFNVARSDLDCWDPGQWEGSTHVSGPERAALEGLLGAGLVDLARERHPDDPLYTWWDYRQGSFRRGWGLRIDYLFVDSASATSLSEIFVDRETRKGERPSDHAALVARFFTAS